MDAKSWENDLFSIAAPWSKHDTSNLVEVKLDPVGFDFEEVRSKFPLNYLAP